MKNPKMKKTLLTLSLLAAGALSATYFTGGFTPSQQQQEKSTSLISPAYAKNASLEKMGTHPLGDQELGQKDAPVVMVEYASFTCPHCGSFHKHVYPQIKKELINTGKVRFIYRDFPLDNTSFAISAVTRCIAKDKGNDKFFPLINMLFDKQDTWMRSQELKAELVKITKLAGYTEKNVDDCLKREPISKGINEVREYAAEKLGVRGTPTLFINGERYEGHGNFEGISKKVQSLLKN